MKKHIYEIIEVSKEDYKASHVYDLVMMFIIALFHLLLKMNLIYLI